MKGFEKKGVSTVYVKILQDTYNETRTSVKSAREKTEDFTVKIRVHRASALSPYLLSLVVDELTKTVRDEAPRYVMFADHVVLADDKINVF